MMRRFRSGPVASALLLEILGGCAGGRQLAITPRIASGEALKIRSASVLERGQSIVVSGTVRRPALARGPVPGHLHILVTFLDGRRDLVADANWGTIPVRGARTGRYLARLPISNARAISSITVSYARKADVADTTPGRKS